MNPRIYRLTFASLLLLGTSGAIVSSSAHVVGRVETADSDPASIMMSAPVLASYGTSPVSSTPVALSSTSSAAGSAVTSQVNRTAKFNMSYIYFGLAGNYVKQVDAANGAMQVVAPSYFELNADGSLRLSAQATGTFIQSMHDRGIRVVPYLSNEWDRNIGRMALQQRAKLSDDIVAAVAKLGVDGVNIDIENVTAADRAAYTDFARMLREKLPAGKEVSVAVAPNPDNDKTGLATAYDYKELAQYCDYLMIMAYDESYPGDPTPGPVASLAFVEKSVQTALKQVSADKLVLGVPFYGRLWKEGDPSFDGSGLSDIQAEAFVSRYKGKAVYDEKQGAMRATFTIGANDIVSKVGGRVLPAGSYTVWYENDSSLQAKLTLVGKYGLKGTGSWSLGQETPSTWSYYSLWLNGTYFSDVLGHWAEGDIRTAAASGWMTGAGAAMFAPERSLTRAEAATVFVRALGLSGTAAGTAAAAPFTDVPASHWAAHEINVAAQHGYVDGFEGGTFAPDQPITREQMCTLLARVLALPIPAAVTAPPYSDVPAQSLSAPAIAALSGRGVVDGYDDGTFRPQAPITRAQMAALLVRLAPSLASASAAAKPVE